MWNIFKNSPDINPSKKVLAEINPLGESIKLKNGIVVQKPNPEIIAALQKIDPRVVYFPTNLEAAEAAEIGRAWYRGVTDLLPDQILTDFPGDIFRTRQRGVVVSLRDEFPLFDKMQLGHLEKVNNVLTILCKGTDNGYTLGNTSFLVPQRGLSHHVAHYLESYTTTYTEELFVNGKLKEANNLFPGLLVYENSQLTGIKAGDFILNPKALLAIYVTDRII